MTGVLLWISLNIDLTQSKIWALCFSFFVPLLSQRLLITWSWWTVTLRVTSQIKQRLVRRFDVDRRKSWTKQSEVNVRARNATSLSARETLNLFLKTCRKRWKRQARFVCTYGSVAVTFCRTFHQGHVFPRFFSEVTFPRLFANVTFSRAIFLLRIFSPPFLLFPVFYQVHDVSTNKTLSRSCSLPLFRPLLWSIRRSVLSLAVRLLCLRLGFP